MKKIYSKPQTDIIWIDAPQVLTMSQEQYPGSFGQIPGMEGAGNDVRMA